MKRFMILGASYLVSVVMASGTFLAATTGARAAIECQAEIIKGRSSHWSYRLIDGRKCWYEGKNKPSKTDLFWPERAEPAAAANPAMPQARSTGIRSTNAQASPPPAESEDVTDPEDGSCCWPPQKADSRASQDSFEARWHSLGLKPRN